MECMQVNQPQSMMIEQYPINVKGVIDIRQPELEGICHRSKIIFSTTNNRTTVHRVQLTCSSCLVWGNPLSRRQSAGERVEPDWMKWAGLWKRGTEQWRMPQQLTPGPRMSLGRHRVWRQEK